VRPNCRRSPLFFAKGTLLDGRLFSPRLRVPEFYCGNSPPSPFRNHHHEKQKNLQVRPAHLTDSPPSLDPFPRGPTATSLALFPVRACQSMAKGSRSHFSEEVGPQRVLRPMALYRSLQPLRYRQTTPFPRRECLVPLFNSSRYVRESRPTSPTRAVPARPPHRLRSPLFAAERQSDFSPPLEGQAQFFWTS